MARATRASIADRLAAAHLELAEAQRQVARAEASRNAALLADDDSVAAELATTIDGLRAVIRGWADKIALLESEHAREQTAAVARRHETHLREFEQTLAQADTAGDALQAAVETVEQKFREVIKLRELALSMWPFGKSSHGDAVARTPEGCALAAGAVATLLQHELHRIGSEAPLGGFPGERIKVPLPGGVPPRLTPLVDQKTKQPIPLKPLNEVLRHASRFAVETLRGNKFIPPVVPQPELKGPRLVFDESAPAVAAPAVAARATQAKQTDPPASAAKQIPVPAQPPAAATDISPLAEYVPPAFRERLAALHSRQMKLAAGDDDAAYEQCLADLVALRAEIEAAKNGEAA
jgi:hypothetical protein